MSEIFVLIEHRQGAIRDISFELLACGRKLARKNDTKVTAILFGNETGKFIDKLKSQAHRVLIIENDSFENFNSETYQKAFSEIIQKEKPVITLIGNTSFGLDICPSLATQLEIPFATDCLAVDFIDDKLSVTRQMYDGKLNAKAFLKKSESYILAIRGGCFIAEEGNLNAEIEKLDISVTEPDYRKFVEYIEAATGDVDITKADIVIGVGRGIREKDNLAVIEDFADTIGGVLACSRPIVDSDWLPKDRQVGSSGKVIKPKLYIALGISGAFQHVMGIKSSDTIIAVNKDANAPIFNDADYGIVDDLMKVIPILKEKVMELK
ncbi:MAG: electron transfer flavoprotein subunit alpha/FixB family protein [Candidatus Cloacimonetes bacterium]|nr:electron transfer flavoprotein subunit alpha/FixB family protein [Candidatus Cloacimonadota bacterium]